MHSRFRLEKDRDGSEAVTICQRRAKDYLSLHLRCRRPPHHDTDMGDTDRPAQQRTDSLMPDTITAPLTQPVLTRTYEYDHRGNLTKELQEGIPVHSYAYNAMDRLEKAWSHTPDGAVQTEASYYYNGLGQRVGKSMYTGAAGQTTGTMGQPAGSMDNAVHEDYLPDLTRPYHNLLSVTRNDGAPAKTFHWDSNAAAMEENGRLHYYLQDEMGSPVRVSGYDGTESMTDGNHDATAAYLTYGYDEFGNDLARTISRELEEDGIPSPYTMQGEGQPFGYTGYRYDTDSGTYFAQAREYQPEVGRFIAEDGKIYIKYFNTISINQYIYCWNAPMTYTDLEGTDIYYFYDPNTFPNDNARKDAENDKRHLEAMYDTEVHLEPVSTRQDFIDGWNAMPDDESIEAVIMYSHSNSNLFQINTTAEYEINNEGEKEWKGQEKSFFTSADVKSLDAKDIGVFVAIGCNVGQTDNNQNIACAFISKDNNLGIEKVIAADGKVSHIHRENNHLMRVRDVQEEEKEFIKKGITKTTQVEVEIECDGFKVYQYGEDGKLNIRTLGHEFINVAELIEASRQLPEGVICDGME